MTEQEIKDKAMRAYPYDIRGQYAYDANDGKRVGYIRGYKEAIEQMMKDFVDVEFRNIFGEVIATFNLTKAGITSHGKYKALIIKEDLL